MINFSFIKNYLVLFIINFKINIIVKKLIFYK